MLNYTVKNIDVRKFEDALIYYKKEQDYKTFIEQEKLTSFHKGYTRAIDDVIEMLHCSNYEKCD